MITICIANNKGGVGKTTTAYWLGRCLAERGHSVTLIDLDPQANLTAATGNSCEAGVVEVLRGVASVLEVLAYVFHLPTAPGNLAIVPSRADLVDLADDLTVKQLGVLRLRSALERYAADLDGSDEIVLIDCPPNVGALTYSALIAADYVLIPTQPAPWSLEGVGRIREKVDEVGEALGRKPAVLGAVATLVDGRVGDHKWQLEQMATSREVPLLGTVPRREGIDSHKMLHAAYTEIAAVLDNLIEWEGL